MAIEVRAAAPRVEAERVGAERKHAAASSVEARVGMVVEVRAAAPRVEAERVGGREEACGGERRGGLQGDGGGEG